MRPPDFAPSSTAVARRSMSAIALALGSIATLALTSCGSQPPPAPMSEDERINKAQMKAEEHKVFYEGWLHPGDN